jgi:hypothetical protein
MPELPKHEFSGLVLDANLHVLNRQVLDNDMVPVGHVDDLEFEDPDPPNGLDSRPPVVTNLILNSGFWQRVFGGRPPLSQLYRVPWSAVQRVGTAIDLGEPESSYPVTWTEHWVREQVIARIPGGRRAPE